MGQDVRRKNDEFAGHVFAAIEKIVAELGYECVNVALVTEDGRSVLRVMIDSIGGINVKDCETVSNAVNRCLDASTASGFSDRYYLEVSSPGLERPLFTPADYERFKGKEARIRTGELVDGRKTHVGFIVDSDEKSVTLDTEQGTRVLFFSGVTRASLVFRGLEPQLPKKPAKRKGKPDRAEKIEKSSAETVIEEED